MGLRVAIFTVGCRANQADSDRLASALDPSVVELVDGRGAFDLAVINTCCVTSEAERDCRKLARRALRASPPGGVVVTGCAVSAIGEFGADLGPGVKLLGGGGEDPATLVDWILELASRLSGEDTDALEPAIPVSARTRPLLKVQDGCGHRCAYCVVPAARGAERSEPLEVVIGRVVQLAGEGYSEVVLTGVQLGAWGRDLPGRPRVAELVRAVADRFAPGRVRLSSIEPWSVDEELLGVVAGHERVCAHLHLPLQSGDDRVLAAMGRGYRAADVVELVRRARDLDPDLAFGTDVICGFPGETWQEFESTLSVLADLEPSYLHVFPFSPRPGTRAAAMEQAMDRGEIKQRVAEAIALGDRYRRRYRQAQLGQVREVIVEDRDGPGWRGLTDTFIPVSLPVEQLESGQLLDARLGPGIEPSRVTAAPVRP
jgi:threonylcarbamoyladenosine tRNA methylthiotransferase MtaB